MFSKFWQKIFPAAESASDLGQPIEVDTEINHPEIVVNNNPGDSTNNDYPRGDQLSSESEINFPESEEMETGSSSTPLEPDDLEIKL